MRYLIGALRNTQKLILKKGNIFFKNTAGLKGTQRPDIIGKTISGKYQYWEYASKSQASGKGFSVLSNKMELIDN